MACPPSSRPPKRWPGRHRPRPGRRSGSRGRRTSLRLPLRSARLPGPVPPGGRGHGAHRPGRLPGPVPPRRRARAGRGGAARRRPGSALPGRARLPPAGCCSTPSWPAGCSASRGWAWPRWSKKCSASGWRRGTGPRTGPPARCPTDWLRYAALDVEVLVELRDALAEQLEEQGKAEWARQEFAAVLAAKPPGPRPDPVAAHLGHSPRPHPARPGRGPRPLAGARRDRPAAGPVSRAGAARRRHRRGRPGHAVRRAPS